MLGVAVSKPEVHHSTSSPLKHIVTNSSHPSQLTGTPREGSNDDGAKKTELDEHEPLTSSHDPFALFAEWYAAADAAEPEHPNAMTLSTVGTDGRPSSRTVLMKSFDARGFVFFTNEQSRKGTEISGNPNVALLFFWKSLGRQVRVEGTAAPIPASESEAYFASRDRSSQLGAHASLQSQVLPSRSVLLERIDAAEQQFKDKDVVPRPPHWGGFRVKPTRIEFWVSLPSRWHDRVIFDASNRDTDDGEEVTTWTTHRQYP